MTPNYFRIAQDLSRTPKAARANWYFDWALAYSPGAGLLRKNSGNGAEAVRPTKGKR
jgi:hypothetical protein